MKRVRRILVVTVLSTMMAILPKATVEAAIKPSDIKVKSSDESSILGKDNPY